MCSHQDKPTFSTPLVVYVGRNQPLTHCVLCRPCRHILCLLETTVSWLVFGSTWSKTLATLVLIQNPKAQWQQNVCRQWWSIFFFKFNSVDWSRATPVIRLRLRVALQAAPPNHAWGHIKPISLEKQLRCGNLLYDCNIAAMFHHPKAQCVLVIWVYGCQFCLCLAGCVYTPGSSSSGFCSYALQRVPLTGQREQAGICRFTQSC